jgi:16S rRNA processing protein RimM
LSVRVTIGRIGRAHGIRGDVAVDVRTDEPERRFTRGTAVLADGRALTIAASRWHSGRLLVSFAEIPDRTAAEQLRGVMLEVDIDHDEQPDEEDAYYDRQLVGLAAHTHDGERVGTVSSVVHHEEQDTLVIQADGREIMVPFVAAIVPIVDLEAGHIVIADLPGLLDAADSD